MVRGCREAVMGILLEHLKIDQTDLVHLLVHFLVHLLVRLLVHFLVHLLEHLLVPHHHYGNVT